MNVQSLKSLKFMKSNMFWLVFFVALFVLAGLIDHAQAAEATGSGGGSSLPWEGPIEKIRKSLAGPVAFGFALVGIVVMGAGLIFGGDINEFGRRMMYVVLVISILVFANGLLTGQLFSGAVVPQDLLLQDKP